MIVINAKLRAKPVKANRDSWFHRILEACKMTYRISVRPVCIFNQYAPTLSNFPVYYFQGKVTDFLLELESAQ